MLDLCNSFRLSTALNVNEATAETDAEVHDKAICLRSNFLEDLIIDDKLEPLVFCNCLTISEEV